MELSGNLTRSKALMQLKHIEAVRHQFKKLKIYMDKHTLTSPTTITITKQDGSSEKIIDSHTMHELIIHHNKKHFNQAQGSPPTIQPLLNILGTGLDSSSQKIIDGTITIPNESPPLMKKFLRNLRQQHNHQESPQFPKEKIIQAFKKWKESTTTSPLGINLGN